MDQIDKETLFKLIESGVILAIGLGLFFGLKGRIKGLAHRANLPRLALTPVRLALRYSILVATVVLVLGRWGFHADTIVAVVGTVLGLVAIGFVAVWSVLSNLLCTLMLIVFKPFSVGDDIEIVASGVKGKVVDLSLIYTTLEFAPNETVLVPNNTFFQGAFKRHVGNVTVGLGEQLRQHFPQEQKAA